MEYDIILAPQAVEDFKKLDAAQRYIIRDAFEKYLRHEPQRLSKSRIKRLRGLSKPQYRLRVRDIRVFYDVVEGSVEILAIIPKSKTSEWLEREGEKQ